MPHPTDYRFVASVFRYPGKGGWTFVLVPADLAPPVTRGWGRTPVRAVINGHEWPTSVWRGADGRTLLALPKRVRTGMAPGDVIDVRILFEGDE
jgi:hypothetical protein